MTPYERTIELGRIAADGRFAQFGQDHDSTTDNGSEACTHVCCQYLIKVWTGEDVTINEVSRVAQYRAGDEGMNSGHVDRVIAHWELPYHASWRTGAPASDTADDLIQLALKRGPLLLSINYRMYPLTPKLKGLVAPTNGFARRGGRSDINFVGDHAVIVFGAAWERGTKIWKPRGIDPDHGSAARPDVPMWDAYTARQLGVLWDTPLNTRGQTHVAYLPTKAWTGMPSGEA